MLLQTTIAPIAFGFNELRSCVPNQPNKGEHYDFQELCRDEEFYKNSRGTYHSRGGVAYGAEQIHPTCCSKTEYLCTNQNSSLLITIVVCKYSPTAHEIIIDERRHMLANEIWLEFNRVKIC
jgi:hypothetical protein